MKEIKFKCETITPMFLGGADGKSAELRPPSIKGLMRFWWRAVNGNLSIKELLKKESEIFGGGGDAANKSSFSIKIICDNGFTTTSNSFPNHPIEVMSRGRQFQINILEYLAYGTYQYERGRGNVFIRNYIPVHTTFNVKITVKNDNFLKDILLSFYFLSAFGGIGSRSRNGFGGFNILSREGFAEIGKEYVENIVPTKEMLKPFMKLNSIPSYSAFSTEIKLFKTRNTFNTWDEALAELGKIYKSCRENLENHHQYEKRQYIGAPLDPPNENFKSFLDRHSKPYFLKVIKEGNQYSGQILYLASKYCEGLNKDRYGRDINHSQVNEEFKNVCSCFNNYLSDKLR